MHTLLIVLLWAIAYLFAGVMTTATFIYFVDDPINPNNKGDTNGMWADILLWWFFIPIGVMLYICEYGSGHVARLINWIARKPYIPPVQKVS